MTRDQLYVFKKGAEAHWALVVPALAAMAGAAVLSAGADSAFAASVSVGVAAVSRLALSIVSGDFTFKQAAEIGWAGFSVAVAAIAATVASVTSVDELSGPFVLSAFTGLARPVGAAVLVAIQSMFPDDEIP